MPDTRLLFNLNIALTIFYVLVFVMQSEIYCNGMESEGTLQRASQCFKRRGIPKVSFDCREDMIRIHRAFHGVALVERRASTSRDGGGKCYAGNSSPTAVGGGDPGTNCTYCEGDCVDDAMNLVYDWSTCMGYSTCSRTVMQSHMPSCPGQRDKFSDYLQVEYQCVSKSRSMDICQSGNRVVQSGYVMSPDYPGVYPTNLDCKCTLMADRNDAKITISFIDLLLETKLGRCRADWIMLRQNGAKHRHCGAIMSGTKNITSSGHVIDLQFHSNEFDDQTQNFRYFSRNLKGFWLYFAAEPEANIQISCSRLVSSDPEVAEIAADDSDYDEIRRTMTNDHNLMATSISDLTRPSESTEKNSGNRRTEDRPAAVWNSGDKNSIDWKAMDSNADNADSNHKPINNSASAAAHDVSVNEMVTLMVTDAIVNGNQTQEKQASSGTQSSWRFSLTSIMTSSFLTCFIIVLGHQSCLQRRHC